MFCYLVAFSFPAVRRLRALTAPIIVLFTFARLDFR